MSVVYYGPGEHPAGFIGFRVTVAFDDEYRQSYFKTRHLGEQTDDNPWFRREHLKAQIQNAEWEADSCLYQYRKFVTSKHSTTHPLRSTGVHGLTMNFRLDRRGKWIAVFAVALGHREDGSRKPQKMVYMNELRYSEAWEKAVHLWADEHQILPVDRERVLQHPPEPEQFKSLRRYLNESKGYDIPVEALGPVYREQREHIEQARLKKAVAELKPAPVKQTADKDLEEIETEVLAWFKSSVGGATG